MSIDRRQFLSRACIAGVGTAVVGSIDVAAGTSALADRRRGSRGYGRLVADPAGVLALPAGFSYRVLAEAGRTRLDSGEPTPSDADGTAAFAHAGGTTLVNNHEISGGEAHLMPTPSGLTYDPGAFGGTTSIEVARDGSRVREYVSVAGTHNNCAGGVTPWQTWLTCEETEVRAGDGRRFDHGFVFEVDPADQESNLDRSPIPLRFLGRFPHEAVCVDPDTSVVYETEDANEPHGLFYRWVPPAGFTPGRGALHALATGPGGDTAGTLQAMLCRKGNREIVDLSQATRTGTRFKVEWVDVPDRLATDTSTRMQLPDNGVTRSRKLEGAWWGDGGAYFVASFARASDGSRTEHDGQVWFYDPRTESVTLTTIFGVNPDPDVDSDHYDGPDNITTSPYGGVILAEDGEGIQHLVGVTEQGRSYPIARNDLNDSEFTGPVFSADGSTLFANIQDPGLVLAITGPWGRPSSAHG